MGTSTKEMFSKSKLMKNIAITQFIRELLKQKNEKLSHLTRKKKETVFQLASII